VGISVVVVGSVLIIITSLVVVFVVVIPGVDGNVRLFLGVVPSVGTVGKLVVVVVVETVSLVVGLVIVG